MEMTQEELLQEAKILASKSLKFLCMEILWKGNPPDRRMWGPVHDDLEKFLMKPARKKAILLPRGHLKSEIVTISKSIQHILKNPNVRILIANQIWDISRGFLRSIKGYLEGSPLPQLYGNFVSNRWNEDEIIVRQRTNRGLKEPTVATTGVEAEKTGGHYDVIVLDDLTGLTNSMTKEQREKTKRFRRSMVNLLDPGGIIYEIGTRWHLDDTFSEIFEKESDYYDIMVRQVVENGKILFPEKFSQRFNAKYKDFEMTTEPCMDYIDHLKKTLPYVEFSAQYLNNPIDEENQDFKKSFFRYFDRRPENLYIALTMDLAISEKSFNDYTAFVVTGMDRYYNIFVLDYLKGRWNPSDVIRNVFQMQAKWKPNAVGMETQGLQKTLKYAVEQEMRTRGVHFPVEELTSGIQADAKKQRIRALEPFYRDGKVHHANWMKDRELEIELMTFPKGKHEDLIDALSYSLQVLSPGMGERPSQVPEGSWEHTFQQARRNAQAYRGFFHYG